MPTLNLTLLSGNGPTNNWSDVSTPLIQIRTLLNDTKLDYLNMQDNGLRTVNLRSHANAESGRIRVWNDTGGTLDVNTLVYLSGTYSDGTYNIPTVAKARSTSSTATHRFATAIIDASILTGEEGTAVLVKEVSGLDTSGSTVGNPVYLSTTAGGWSLSMGDAYEWVQIVGYVTAVSATVGRILFSPKPTARVFCSPMGASNSELIGLRLSTTVGLGHIHVDGSILALESTALFLPGSVRAGVPGYGFNFYNEKPSSHNYSYINVYSHYVQLKFETDTYSGWNIVYADHHDGQVLLGKGLYSLQGTKGSIGVGTSTVGTSGDGVIAITADGTVPSTSPAGIVQIFADDSSDGSANATLAFRTEQAVESAGSTPNRRLQIWINGVEYYLPLEAV